MKLLERDHELSGRRYTYIEMCVVRLKGDKSLAPDYPAVKYQRTEI